MTQEQLASAAGVSVDLVKKLEQGKRQSARLTSLIALANALDVSLSDLTDKRPRLDEAGDRLVLGLRDALLSSELLAGVDPVHDDGAATPPRLLQAAVDAAWAAYWRGDFNGLARTLPGLLGEARISARAHGGSASPVLAQAYQVTAGLLVQLGRDDLAAVGAERAIAVAAGGSDELQSATMYGTYAWALISQGRHVEAERVAIAAAQRIEPRFATAGEPHLVVWGGLVLWAMAAAVEGNRPEAAGEYLVLSRLGAARMDRDRHDYQVSFGPTQVAMQATYAHAVAGRPDRALDAAKDVRREDLLTISYGRHLLDVARAYADTRDRDRAVEVLTEARNASPVWFRHQVPARTLVADLRARHKRLSPTLRDLARSLDPRQQGGGT